MKKIKPLILVPCFFIFVITSGQNAPLLTGIEMGPGLVSLRGNSILETYRESKLSFSAGFFFQYNLDKKFSLRTNISVERKGCSFGTHPGYDDIGNFTGNIKSSSNFTYLIVPALARFTFGNKQRIFIQAGPFMGFLIKQTDISKKEGGSKTTMNNISKFKKEDFGLTAGTGVEIPLKKDLALSFEVRDNHGLVNISKVPVINNGSVKTNSLSLLFGCTYNLK